MNPTDCPRFDRCSAPLCPLDPHWRERRHLEGDAVCVYLREASRNDGRPPQALDVPDELAEAVVQQYPEFYALCGSVRKALKRAARAGPQLGRRPGIKNPGCEGRGEVDLTRKPELEGTDCDGL